jgi:hypothetical protein
MNEEVMLLNEKMTKRGFRLYKLTDNVIEWYMPTGLTILQAWIYKIGQNDYIGYDNANGNFSATTFQEAATRLLQRLENITEESE